MTTLALTIAGSESNGAAGLQADLRAMQTRGVFGIASITCIVAVDPKNNWVHRMTPIDPEILEQQLESIEATYPLEQLDTVKIGMLGTTTTIGIVADFLRRRPFRNVIVDPVLICKGQEAGEALAIDTALKEEILPLATVLTPNLFEAEQLSGLEIHDVEGLEEAARKIQQDSGAAVIAKGGVRLTGAQAVDVYVDETQERVLAADKIGELAVNGAGCTLAAVIAAEIAKGEGALLAAIRAKSVVRQGIEQRLVSQVPVDAVVQTAQQVG